MLFARPSEDERYINAVAEVCKAGDAALDGTPRDYFANVAMISSIKRRGLAPIEPPPERAGLHGTLRRSEDELAREAAATPPPAPPPTPEKLNAFHASREKQARLDAHYRTIGIKGCSD